MKNIFDMTGKSVVITGGAGDLGQAMTRSLLDYGANVTVVGRNDRLGPDFDEWRKAGKLVFSQRDLARSEGAAEALADAEKAFGGVDVLVNNAAFGGGAGGKSCEFHLDKVDDETWATGIDGTLGLSFRCIRAVIPLMEKRGGGVIVNICSMYSLIAPDFSIYGDDIPWNPPTYGAGKAGLQQLTRYAASALACKNIRVNALTPGPFPRITPKSNMEFIGRLSKKTMMGRTGRSEELCGALLLLCSDASSYMTGTNVTVDGGMTTW